MNQLFLPGFAPAPGPDTPLLLNGRASGLPLPPLFNYPLLAGALRSTHAKCIGRAGECLLDSLLIRFGFESFSPGENLGFDRLVALDVGGRDLVNLARIQIKTVTFAKGGFYTFNLACGYRGSPAGRRSYHAEAFDIAACVILPKNAIFFSAEKRPRYAIHVSEVEVLQSRPQASLLHALRQVWTAKHERGNVVPDDPDCDCAAA